MGRTVSLDIGVNGAFLTRRWEKPDNWMRLTRECGYQYHSFCADVLDPFFSGDRTYQAEQAAAVREAAKRYGVTIIDIYTGVATHRFHGLSHSDPRVRRRMAEWIEGCCDIAAMLHVDAIGGHWDAISSEALADPSSERQAVERQYATFRNLAITLRRKHMRALYQEQMYIPSEKPWLLDEAEEFLVNVNKDSHGVPIYLTLDTGHAAGMHFGATSPDTEYLEWLCRFGSVAEVVHVQQTTLDASRHWPFTDEYNKRGGIVISEVINALRHAHEMHGNRSFGFMTPVSRQYLVLEYIPGSTTPDSEVLNDLTASGAHLRRFVPEGGLTLNV